MPTIVHITEDFSQQNTGITSSIWQLSNWLSERSFEVEVLTTGGMPVAPPEGVVLRCHTAPWPPLWRFSASLGAWLNNALNDRQLVHVHGIWMYPQWMAMTISSRMKRPFVLTPHNMLGGWLWR